MIKSGSRLDTALALARRMEDSSPLGLELAECQSRLAQGHAQFAELGAKAKVIPPLFFWLAGGSGEDLQAGLARAAQVYHDRAVHKCQLMLYSVLSVSMLALGAVIVIQVVSVLHLLFRNMLSLVELG